MREGSRSHALPWFVALSVRQPRLYKIHLPVSIEATLSIKACRKPHPRHSGKVLAIGVPSCSVVLGLMFILALHLARTWNPG